MRLWSLHPEYLDSKGLVALWREALLAKHVLEGKTKGYRHHPQLDRFWAAADPQACISQYLSSVYEEAVKRGYNFDISKINISHRHDVLTVTAGQMKYEADHLLKKLKTRDHNRYDRLKDVKYFNPHPLFRITGGDLEPWEIAR